MKHNFMETVGDQYMIQENQINDDNEESKADIIATKRSKNSQVQYLQAGDQEVINFDLSEDKKIEPKETVDVFDHSTAAQKTHDIKRPKLNLA